MTHTYALLEVSEAAYTEIAQKLRAAGYDHVFDDAGEIDMHGIGLAKAPTATRRPTVAEIEAILADESPAKVVVNADGSVSALVEGKT